MHYFCAYWKTEGLCFAFIISAPERQKQANPWSLWPPNLAHLVSSSRWETLSRWCLKEGNPGLFSCLHTYRNTSAHEHRDMHALIVKDERGLILIFGLSVLALRGKYVSEVVRNDTCNDAHSFCVHFIHFRTLLYPLAHLSIIMF